MVTLLNDEMLSSSDVMSESASIEDDSVVMLGRSLVWSE